MEAIPITVMPSIDNAYRMKTSLCTRKFIRNDGTTFFLDVDTSGLNISRLERQYPAHTVKYSDYINTAPDGVYCYVVYNSDNPQIAFVKVESLFELASSHNFIVYITQITSMLFAGEFIKTGTNIKYNYSSGTYLQEYNDTNGRNIASILEQRTKIMQEILRAHGITGTYDRSDTTFITEKNVPLTQAELDSMKSLGIIFRGYPTFSLCSESKLMKGYLNSPVRRTNAQTADFRAKLAAAEASMVQLGGYKKRKTSHRRKASKKEKRTKTKKQSQR
jgi:hypothetical protein